MSQEFHEHWLSAYLDDELSSEERALVERQLAEDPQTRQLLEDLRRVRGLVATLPNWQGKDFQFDMNRLASSELDDEDDLEPLGSKSDPRAAHRSNDTEKPNTEKPNIARPQPAKPASAGMSPAAWRGILSLAAGILLLVLCVPLFWQRFASRVAMNDAAPGAQARIQSDNIVDGGVGEAMGGMGGGMGMGGGIDMPSAESAYGTMAEATPTPAMPATPAAPAEFDAAQNFSRGSPPGAPAPRSSLPPNIASGGVGGFRGGLGQPSDPAAVSEKTELGMETANMERGRNAPQAKRVESNLEAALSEMGTSGLALNIATENQLMFAKSAAWSDAEVAAALPQLSSVVPGSRKLSEATTAGKQVQRDGSNEWLISNMPPAADVTSFFTQIQTTHALTPIPLGAAESNRITPRDKAMADQAPVDEPAKPMSANKEQTLNGNIVLFVTDSEAKQILSSVLGRSTGGYWRVKPAQSDKPEQPSADGNAKVILLLKQSP